jgi:hypothetical protein
MGMTWSQGNLLLSGAQMGDAYRIVDAQGKTLRAGVITSSSISGLELPPGMYFFVTSHQKLTLLIP